MFWTSGRLIGSWWAPGGCRLRDVVAHEGSTELRGFAEDNGYKKSVT